MLIITLNRYLSRCSCKNFTFTISSENITITRCEIIWVTIKCCALLQLIEYIEFSKSHLGKNYWWLTELPYRFRACYLPPTNKVVWIFLFSQACNSVHREGGGMMSLPVWSHVPSRDLSGLRREALYHTDHKIHDTHPTGMFSCYL